MQLPRFDVAINTKGQQAEENPGGLALGLMGLMGLGVAAAGIFAAYWVGRATEAQPKELSEDEKDAAFLEKYGYDRPHP